MSGHTRNSVTDGTKTTRPMKGKRQHENGTLHMVFATNQDQCFGEIDTTPGWQATLCWFWGDCQTSRESKPTHSRVAPGRSSFQEEEVMTGLTVTDSARSADCRTGCRILW